MASVDVAGVSRNVTGAVVNGGRVVNGVGVVDAPIDPHPDEDEIKQFVAVGPSDEYSVTVHKDTFDTGFIIVTIVFIVIIATVLITCIFFAIKEADIREVQQLPIRPPPTPTLHSNLGAVASMDQAIDPSVDGSSFTTEAECRDGLHTAWISAGSGGRCVCRAPYFGPACSLEKHDRKFYALGTPNEDRLGLTVLDETMATAKSFHFDGNTCSDQCLERSECVGFIYHEPGFCTLLQDQIIIPASDNIVYTTETNATLYVKSSDQLKFEGRIFLSEFPNHFPARFWLVKEGYHFLQLFPRELGVLNFYPNYINLADCYTGIYCLFPFTIADVPVLLNHTDLDRCYIHDPKTPLILPDHWRYHLPIYVMYLPAN